MEGFNFNNFTKEKQKLYLDRQKIIESNLFPNDLSIISNTCIGGRLYNDYHRKFLSPTIDFYMMPKNFVEFCINLEYYLSLDIVPLPEYKEEYLNNFLFCKIGKLTAAFGHSNTDFEKIIENWNKRRKRVNYKNIVVICTDRSILNNSITRCEDNVVKKFGEIPYKKVLFTTKKYDYNYTSYLKSFCNEQACPEATRPSITRKGKYILEEDGFDLDNFILNR